MFISLGKHLLHLVNEHGNGRALRMFSIVLTQINGDEVQPLAYLSVASKNKHQYEELFE